MTVFFSGSFDFGPTENVVYQRHTFKELHDLWFTLYYLTQFIVKAHTRLACVRIYLKNKDKFGIIHLKQYTKLTSVTSIYVLKHDGCEFRTFLERYFYISLQKYTSFDVTTLVHLLWGELRKHVWAIKVYSLWFVSSYLFTFLFETLSNRTLSCQ